MWTLKPCVLFPRLRAPPPAHACRCETALIWIKRNGKTNQIWRNPFRIVLILTLQSLLDIAGDATLAKVKSSYWHHCTGQLSRFQCVVAACVLKLWHRGHFWEESKQQRGENTTVGNPTKKHPPTRLLRPCCLEGKCGGGTSDACATLTRKGKFAEHGQALESFHILLEHVV